jgi:hypothetical protein
LQRRAAHAYSHRSTRSHTSATQVTASEGSVPTCADYLGNCFFAWFDYNSVCRGQISILGRVQSVRALLTALFIATQVIGVVPLLCDHTKEIYGKAVTVTAARPEAIAATAGSDQVDPDGDLDDDCCALDSLAGPLPNVASIAAYDLVSPHVFPTPASPLAGRHSRVPERPPKHTSSSDRTQT